MRKAWLSTILPITFVLAWSDPSYATHQACGAEMDLIDDTKVFSNGAQQGTGESCTSSGPFGYRYQCTELVDRYFGYNWFDTDGMDYFPTAGEKGFIAYPNENGGSIFPPQHGDALGFSHSNGFGHVALIDKVWQNPDGIYIVEIVEQNWKNEGRGRLNMRRDTQGRYVIENRNYYTTQGWLRYPKKYIEKRRNTIHASNKMIEDVFGIHQEPITWYFPSSNELDTDKTSRNVQVEHYPGKDCYYVSTPQQVCDAVVVYDVLGGADSAYIVGWQQWRGWVGVDGIRRGGWEQAGGPRSAWGNPITNSYHVEARGVWRQDFQKGYAEYENFFAYPTTAPGMYASGWNLETSYAFAEAYERSGARNKVGEAFDNGDTMFVHNWNGVWIQDFRYGTYSDDGQSAVIYSPKKNMAYHIRAGFWGWYKLNSGPQNLGAPMEDERCLTTQPCTHSTQAFERGVLDWRSESGVAVTYASNPTAIPNSMGPAAPKGLTVR